MRRSIVRWCASAVAPARDGNVVSPVLLYRTMWGMDFPVAADSRQWAAFLESKVKAHGFHGIECCSPGPFFSFAADPDAIGPVLADVGLDLVLQVQTLDYPVISASWRAHADALRSKIESIAGLKGVTPALINCHGGKDSMSIDDGLRFFEAALTIQEDVFGAQKPMLAFETHRQRLLHSPFALLEMHRRGPEVMQRLRYNADLSHYVVGLERLPSTAGDGEFWPQVMEILEAQAVYIHARVGTAQCIQAADPFDGDALTATALSCFMEWWRALAAGMRRRGAGLPVRLCPEYGPPPYLPCVPSSSAAGAAVCPLEGLERTVLAAAGHLKYL